MAVKEITDRIQDYDFDLITARLDRHLPKNERLGKVNVYRLGIGWPRFDKICLAFFGQRLALKLHREQPFSAIWAVMASFGGLAAMKFKKQARLPFLLTLQEGDAMKRIISRALPVMASFKKIFSLADALQSISSYLDNWGLEMGFKGKVREVVSNGVDIEQFTRNFALSEVKAVRQSFGFPAGSKVAVTASRLVIKNGLADLIKAMALLPKEYCLYICGTGDLEATLQALAKQLKLRERVAFAGYKSHEALALILKAGDIFIRPSLSEGLGNAFLEAMAAGLPTIGTLVGGIPDFLTDGETGLVCEPGNPKSIADSIKRAGALSNEEKTQLHLNAMKLIKERYNWDYIAGRMKNIFEQII